MFSLEFSNSFAETAEVSTRKVGDIVHGFIDFPLDIWKFIDKPEFQRLRSIKQLGAADYVFPCATHSRFEHSLGTGYLCQAFMKELTKNEVFYPTNDIKNSAIKTLTLAGLFHDIGHGPFSHMFDNQFVPELWPNDLPKWEHEVLSGLIFEKMVRKYEDLSLKDEQLQRVIALISGNSQGAQRPWEFELVNNKTNGFDVDKLDYIRRDAFYLGVKDIYIDLTLIIQNTKIFRDQDGKAHLHYNYRYAEKILSVYQSRYKLFKHYYLHRVTHAIELMLCDALILLEKNKNSFLNIMKTCEGIYRLKDIGYLNMSQQQRAQYCQHLTNYQNLNDGIIERIKNQKAGDNLDLKEAQKIIDKIVTRKLYSLVTQIRYSTPCALKIQSIKLKNKEIKRQILEEQTRLYSNEAKRLLNNQNVRVYSGVVNFGSKTYDPSGRVKYYNGGEILTNVNPYEISMLKTDKFNEFYIRVFVTDHKTSNEVRERLETVFENVREKYFSEWSTSIIPKSAISIDRSEQ